MLIFSAVLISIGSVSAQQAFAIEGQGTLYATEPYRCELWSIDPSDGNAILLGNTLDGEQPIQLPSLAVHPTSGVMYAGGGGGGGNCSPDSVNSPNLYIVDPSNGDLTFVGATGNGKLIGLDFSSDGTLYAAVKTSGGPGGGGGGTELGIVNTANGATALVGSFGAALNSVAFFGGTLYGVGYNDELYTINTDTGAANLIQNVSPSIAIGASQFACDGTYYVGEGSAGDGMFGTLDITNGDFTSIAAVTVDETMGGMAFIETCQNTPDDVCNDVTDGQFPNGIGEVGLDTVLVKCFDAENSCFADGVPVKSNDPTTCSFAVIAANSYGDTLIVQDTLPAEWKINIGFPINTSVCNGMNANDGTPDNQGKKGDRSATKIECVGPVGEYVGFIVDVQTRESPGKGHKEGVVYKPTSCGTFELNSGAVLLLGDELGDPVLEEGEPIVLAETDPLELEAVGEVCEI